MGHFGGLLPSVSPTEEAPISGQRTADRQIKGKTSKGVPDLMPGVYAHTTSRSMSMLEEEEMHKVEDNPEKRKNTI